jgi:hypothetical protein
LAANAALRRAVAPFGGLLTAGGSRKKTGPDIVSDRLIRDVDGAFEDGPFDLAGEAVLMIHRLIVPMTMAVLAVQGGQALAQGAFPAPLPNQQQRGGVVANDPAFPPVNGAAPRASVGAPAAASPFPSSGAAPVAGAPSSFSPAPPTQAGGPSDACMKGFVPLREEAEKKGKMIKAASDRHAPPDEACKIIGAYGAAEVKMIRYVESNAAKCGIPPQVADQLKNGHKNTEALEKKVCAVAEQVKTRGPGGPSLSEVLGTANAAPEATASRKGGSTFDTLNGNVLQR